MLTIEKRLARIPKNRRQEDLATPKERALLAEFARSRWVAGWYILTNTDKKPGTEMRFKSITVLMRRRHHGCDYGVMLADAAFVLKEVRKERRRRRREEQREARNQVGAFI